MTNDLIHKRNNNLGQYKQLEEQKLYILTLLVEDEITMEADKENISQQTHEFHGHPASRVEDCRDEGKGDDDSKVFREALDEGEWGCIDYVIALLQEEKVL